MKMSKDCVICCETMNKIGRKPVECPYCKHEVCTSCFKIYLLSLVSPTPECMNCHKHLTLEFVSENTPKTFHNKEYRHKRTMIIQSQERSLLPGTQHLVEEYHDRIRNEKEIKRLQEEYKSLRKRLKEINDEISVLRNPKTRIKEEEEKKKFIMGCPVDNCRGFLSQAWKCGTCETYICSKCREPKDGRDDENHVCNPETVETVKMLKNETKPCPNCAVPIYKISGCPQMWCTSCKTTFCWNTGKIETGVIHNPHFYQWQREQNGGVAPRVPGDIPGGCNGMPWVNTVRVIMQQRKTNFIHWQNCHRIVAHIQNITYNQYPERLGQEDNSDLRLSYLIKEINDEQWLKKLVLRQKKAEKNHDVYQVLQLVVQSLIDIFNRFVRENIDIIAETTALRQYANTELQKIQIKYSNKTPFISGTWSI